MKSDKGITLTSLVIYILAMTIILGVISSITIYFYKNTHTIQSTADNSKYLTRLNIYLENDISDTKTVKVEDNKVILTINNGEMVTYTKADDGIYRNKVKICSEVQTAIFVEEPRYDKKILRINISIGETEKIEKTLEYIINN